MLSLVLAFRRYEVAEISASNQIFYFFLELYAIIRSMPVVLWNSQYLVLSLLVRSDLIWDGHLRNCSCCTSRKTCDTAAVRGVNR